MAYLNVLEEVTANVETGEITHALAWLNGRFGKAAAFSTSLGVEDQVIAWMISRHAKGIRIFTLDTGRLFQETYDLLELTRQKFGLTIESYFPDAGEVEKLVTTKGPNSFYASVDDRKECCHIRKVMPLKRALRDTTVWITGIRSSQSSNRADMKLVEWDPVHQIIKYNPLFDWSLHQVEDFVASHRIPVNTLHKKGFTSIGCAPCTRAVLPDEDPRAGRWWWEEFFQGVWLARDRSQRSGASRPKIIRRLPWGMACSLAHILLFCAKFMRVKNDRSERLFLTAQNIIPGGVNSPVRAFRQVGGNPVFMKSAKGAHLFDEDGNRYIDFINSWGPMILGHGHFSVLKALEEQLPRAVSFGAPTDLEVTMADLVVSMVKGVEMVRFVNSGTEACMSAVRLARGFTNRATIIKFEGHYHGHADSFLKKAGSGVATLGIKVNAGIPLAVSADTQVARFNDFGEIEDLVASHRGDLAAIIVEPVAGNMGCVPPAPRYLEHLRKLCDDSGAVLIFDEVMTGFRLSPGGAAERYGVQPDLFTFGKIIGGGLPVGAFGGKKEIMQKIAPLGDVYQAGTLSGNPLAMTAGIATLSWLRSHPEIYAALDSKTKMLERGMHEILEVNKVPHVINRVGSMISVHFCENAVIDFETASMGNNAVFRKFFHHLLENGVYLPPSAFESWFVSDALSSDDILHTLKCIETFRP